MHEFPARLPGLRYLHHGVERKAPFRRAGDLSCGTLCGVCDLSLFLRGISGAVPSLRARRVHPEVFPAIHAVWRNAVPGKPRYADAPSNNISRTSSIPFSSRISCSETKSGMWTWLARIIAYVMANVGNTFSATSLAKFLKSEQRTVAPGNDSQLYQILLRSLSALSGQTGGPARQADTCFQREVLYCRPWHP